MTRRSPSHRIPTPADRTAGRGTALVAEHPTVAEVPSKPRPGLYLTATPIGNAGDLSERAISTLRSVDVIAAEDTRHTARLLAIHGIGTKCVAYHEHNAERMRPRLLARIAAGEAVALVSDAGMPLISDPGFRLVREARDRGLFVTCLPGPSAVTTALVLSGLPTDRFLFAGFPPAKASARRTFLEELRPVAATLVLFESPRRLPESLADMAAVLGYRKAAVARELTKLFEEVVEGRLDALAERYAASGPPQGEVVVVIGPPEVPADAVEPVDVDILLRLKLDRGESLRDAVAAVAVETKRPRRDVYSRALAIGAGGERDDD